VASVRYAPKAATQMLESGLFRVSAIDPIADIVKTRKFLFYIPVWSTRIEKT